MQGFCDTHGLKQRTFLFEAPIPQNPNATYSGALSAASAGYTRKGGAGVYFYQPIYIAVPVSGVYTVRSSSSAIDAYGYLYQASFNLSNLLENYLMEDDDSDGLGQFRMVFSGQPGTTYVLVFTTFASDVQGPFTVTVTGPARATMKA